MRIMPIEKRNISTSRLVFGCMGLGGDWNRNPISADDVLTAERAIDAALSSGITMFDHADIYKMGKSESVFGQVIKRRPQLREQMVIQTKCGIRFPEGDLPGRYDFSHHHIIQSVDESLKRLGVDYLDVLLLHRPDPLVEPEEVAEAFNELEKSGKVRHFGASNMNSSQMKLLQAYCSSPLVVNQLEMSLNKVDWLDQGVLVNQQAGTDVNFSDGIIEYCRLENIQIQAWASLAYGMFSGRQVDDASDAVIQTKERVQTLAKSKETTEEAIVLGWLMRHPAKIQPVIGTKNPERIKNCEDAVRQADLMTREEWYSLYVSSRGNKLP